MNNSPHRIEGETELERLVNRSRLIGSNPELVVHGGGNTSSKIIERDHVGRERQVLRIKGSGTDLRSIGIDGFPGLYLEELLPLRERPAMTDEEMVAYLACSMVDPTTRRPSIETLLHAFLPARHVDHVHADAICALVNQPNAEQAVREALGEDVALVPYIRPGFELSCRVADYFDRRAVVLDKHGLVTWGETHEESYELTLELVDRAGRYLARRTTGHPVEHVSELDEAQQEELLLRLRGRLSRDQRRVLLVDRSQRHLSDRPDVDRIATEARATPDHVLRIGARSAVISRASQVSGIVDEFEAAYRAYFERNKNRLPEGLTMLSPLPKIALVPGLGCIASGTDAKTARVNAEVAFRSHTVTAQTLDAFGEVAWLNEAKIFDFDYWPLELFKLKLAPSAPLLAGHIVLIAGAGGNAGRQIARQISSLGAHLLLLDEDAEELAETVQSLPAGQVVPIKGNPAEETAIDAAVKTAIDSFGGLDGVVLNVAASAPNLLTRRAWSAFEQQGIGGSVISLVDESQVSRTAVEENPTGVRTNVVIVKAGSVPPENLPAIIAFLLSDSSTGISGCVIRVTRLRRGKRVK